MVKIRSTLILSKMTNNCWINNRELRTNVEFNFQIVLWKRFPLLEMMLQ